MRPALLHTGQRGSVLLAMVVGITLLGVFGASLSSMNSSSAISQLSLVDQSRAYNLAESGLRAALNNPTDYMPPSPAAGAQTGAEETYALDANREFRLQLINGGSDIRATGVVNLNTPYQAVRVLTAAVPATPPGPPQPPANPASGYAFITAGDLNLNNRNVIEGSVASADMQLSNEVQVLGDVVANGTLFVGNRATILGQACAKGDVSTNNQAEILGDLNAWGNVTLGANNTHVGGSVFATGGVSMFNLAHVDGDVHAGGDVVLNYANTVSGNVYSGGNVVIYGACVVQGDVHAAGDVTLNWGAQITGHAYAGGTVNVLYGATAGGFTNGAAPPVLMAPEPPAVCDEPTIPLTDFSAGGSDVYVGWNQDKNLAPGSYGVLTLGGQNELTLHGGTYYFTRINGGGNKPVLQLDLSGGDITIFVEGDVTWGNEFSVQVSTGGAYADMLSVDRDLAAKVYLESHGAITFSNRNQWFGTAVAQNNVATSNQNVILGSVSSVQGNVTGNEFSLIFVQSNYARDNW